MNYWRTSFKKAKTQESHEQRGRGEMKICLVGKLETTYDKRGIRRRRQVHATHYKLQLYSIYSRGCEQKGDVDGI